MTFKDLSARMRHRTWLAVWLLMVAFLSASVTARACNDFVGDISGFLRSYRCVISSDCDPNSVCEADYCRTIGCFSGGYSFCVGQEYCGVFPSCSNSQCT